MFQDCYLRYTEKANKADVTLFLCTFRTNSCLASCVTLPISILRVRRFPKATDDFPKTFDAFKGDLLYFNILFFKLTISPFSSSNKLFVGGLQVQISGTSFV